MNWTIIGCGWLGTSLAQSLLQNGDVVYRTTTSRERQFSLLQQGIKATIFNVNSQISTELIDISEVVVLSIPPFDKNNPLTYGESLVHLVQQFKSTTQFIFLGSTGVYPQKNAVFSEEYEFEKEEQATSLFQAEKLLNEFLKKRLTILRLGGLFGDDRHPIYHLEGKTGIKNPNGKINFVGKKDIIFVVQELAAQKKLGGIYNLVYPEHPTREKYYLKKAKELNLVAPKFDYTTNIIREIDSNKIQSTLNFKFMHEI